MTVAQLAHSHARPVASAVAAAVATAPSRARFDPTPLACAQKRRRAIVEKSRTCSRSLLCRNGARFSAEDRAASLQKAAFGFSAEGSVGFSAEGSVGFSAEGSVGFSAEGSVGFSAKGSVGFSAEAGLASAGRAHVFVQKRASFAR